MNKSEINDNTEHMMMSQVILRPKSETTDVTRAARAILKKNKVGVNISSMMATIATITKISQ